ncbi:MAG: hypothetical protein M1831_005667 [Alyxoria varia]|nr:MAG: hypothetical protein M1831_005667 [Alyxoria varia]
MAESRDPVSSTRLYLGNLPANVTKADIENHFSTHGTGEITEVKLMNGFGFIEYKDSMDARDVVPAFHGSDFMGSRLVVQFARGGRPREMMPYNPERNIPRTRRTVFRMSISGLAPETSWQDLKDFARVDGLDVVYSEVSRERDGKGFVEYETSPDLKAAVEKIDGREFKGATIRCIEDVQPERPRDNRHRSRSPPPFRRGYGQPGGHDDPYYDRRGPPRGYSPRGYRERSPPGRRDYYDPRDRYGRPTPPPRGRGPPVDDYPPPARAYPDDAYPPPRRGYGVRGPPPPYADDPYVNGHRGGYDRMPPSPRRSARSPPGRGGYDGGYDRRGYW